ncbi:hypothetical protein KR018_008630 [Drosophila ironensis]|nr:hypothetical protein KR018_008630 [Drosophila ironensis]
MDPTHDELPDYDEMEAANPVGPAVPVVPAESSTEDESDEDMEPRLPIAIPSFRSYMNPVPPIVPLGCLEMNPDDVGFDRLDQRGTYRNGNHEAASNSEESSVPSESGEEDNENDEDADNEVEGPIDPFDGYDFDEYSEGEDENNHPLMDQENWWVDFPPSPSDRQDTEPSGSDDLVARILTQSAAQLQIDSDSSDNESDCIRCYFQSIAMDDSNPQHFDEDFQNAEGSAPENVIVPMAIYLEETTQVIEKLWANILCSEMDAIIDELN